MSWLDLVVIAFIVVHVWLGYLQGFVQGMLALAGFALGLFAVLVGAPWVAAWLDALVPWPATLTLVVAAVVLLMIVRLATGLVVARARAPIDAGALHWRRLDRGLGLLPGAIWGVGSAALVVWLYSAFLGELPARSPVAEQVLAWSRAPIQAVARRIPARMPGIAMFPDGVEFVTGAGEAERRAPPTQLEQQMLDRVNQERRRRGLEPLVWDGRLAEVARAHSRDMLARDYFAHEAPEGTTVAERVKARGVFYLLVGENLAFAPSLEVAHRGLMQSPGHRENILRPGFGHAGIGIVRVPPSEAYEPTHRGRRPVMPLRGTDGYLIVTQVFKN